MRTTLTLDADVAATLKRVQAKEGLTLKEAVNEAMRRGLGAMEGPEAKRPPYRTPSTSLGKCLVGSVDDVAEALAMGEGEDFR
ncbi:MAG: DUF2191 domain-containing protein [Gemmatimonadota bacterium]